MSPYFARWMDDVPELRRAEQRRRERAVALLRRLGVYAVLRGDGAIIVSTSGFDYLRSLATSTEGADPDRAFGIPIYKAPDWTFDPGRVARARLLAVLVSRYRRLVLWVTPAAGRV